MAPADLSCIRALSFDVFGTVVDWRGSIAREGRRLGRAKGIKADWERFADAWRAEYAPSLDRVRRGERPWTSVDALHRETLDQLLPRFGITGLTEAEKDEFNRVWHRLKPWPDSVRGLKRLRSGYLLATLSNGNVALLAEMAKRASLPWDVVLSAELFKRYKPDPEVYLGAAELLGLAPRQIMMVAAHGYDLKAAKAVGFATAFVRRPLEYGPQVKPDLSPDPAYDLIAEDLIDLADQLGA